MIFALSSVSFTLKLLLVAGGAHGAVDANALLGEAPDCFKIFDAISNPVAVRDTNHDDILKCLSAPRTYYDPKGKNATYVWSLQKSPGEGRFSAPLHFTPGDTPEKCRYTVGSNTGDVRVADFVYTDYQTCAVVKMSPFGNQCTLWVAKDAIPDGISEECLTQYTNICGNDSVPLYDENDCASADIYAILT
ncbi:uncharacterized protein LOC144151476 [Haemaphysalis longicornis]